MARKRKRGLCVLSFSLGTIALPLGVVTLVHRGSWVGIFLIPAGMA